MLEHEQIQGWLSSLYPVLAPQPVSESVYDRMERVLGVSIKDEADIVFLMQVGVPATAYQRAVEELKLLPGYVLSAARARLLVGTGMRLDIDDSDRLLRLVRLYSKACLMLGEDAARAWLRTPVRWRAGVVRLSPLDLAVRDSGARLAEQLLQRAAHGVH